MRFGFGGGLVLSFAFADALATAPSAGAAATSAKPAAAGRGLNSPATTVAIPHRSSQLVRMSPISPLLHYGNVTSVVRVQSAALPSTMRLAISAGLMPYS